MWLQKNGMVGPKKISPPLLVLLLVRDPGLIKIRIRDKHLGSTILEILSGKHVPVHQFVLTVAESKS